MKGPRTRRRFLTSAALAGIGSVAGCVSSGTPDQASTERTDTSTATSQTPTTSPDSLDDWLADANGYDGTPDQYGPLDQPRIAVGHPTEDGLAFDPPVIEVVPMTLVTWDWAHEGGRRNVVALDGTFDSGRTNAQSGTSYEYIFDEVGEYPFVCEPYRDEGMKGAVIVREPPTTGYPKVDEWAVQSGNFDGVVDETDTDTATVTVGAKGNGGHFAFDPVVLKVSAGTEVRWEWQLQGGAHNVVFEDLDLDSGRPVAEEGVNFSYTFEEPGTYRYACLPHEGQDMKGVIIVE